MTPGMAPETPEQIRRGSHWRIRKNMVYNEWMVFAPHSVISTKNFNSFCEAINCIGEK